MKVLITGVTGQDGSYLAEYLLSRGYEVHGLVRQLVPPLPKQDYPRIKNILGVITLHSAKLESRSSVAEVVANQKFDECYHLAAQSFVAASFKDEFSTLDTNINGTHNILAAFREFQPTCRVYFAGTSEMFGKAEETPQTESTRFHPRSPYAISKVAGFELTRHYREAYDMFCCTGMLFNHESPRRGIGFVTRKITLGAARIKLGLDDEIRLGNLDVKRDWGHSSDYVRAMHLMLQQEKPDDFVVATGEAHSVKEFCELAFAEVGLDFRDYVKIDKSFYRPTDVEMVVGNAAKAHEILGWKPTYRFEEIVAEMVQSDLKLLQGGLEASDKLSEESLERAGSGS